MTDEMTAASDARGATVAVEELLALAIARPDDALTLVDRTLGLRTDPRSRSIARQARGIVWRDRGRLDEALAELRSALRLARHTADPDREADVRATYGATLTMAGRTRAGLDELALAATTTTDPTVRAKVRMRRGWVLTMIAGRHREAVAELGRALPGLRSAGERVWEARTLNLLGLARLALGDVARAEADLRAAEDIFGGEGQALEAVQTLQNRGLIAFCRGDLPSAFALYDAAADGYAALGAVPAELAVDRSEALLSAGLADDAVAAMAGHLERDSVPAFRRAELTLMMAVAEMAGGRPEASLARARAARQQFRRQRRDDWSLLAELAVLKAREQLDHRGARLARDAGRVAAELERAGLDEAPAAWLVAGRLAARSGLAEADGWLARAARSRTDPASAVRSVGWLAYALARERRADIRGALLGCRRGLDAVDEHRMALGSAELRAASSVHGDELARLALRRAADGSPRRLLWWSERWRATALARPPVRPPADDAVAETTAALRDAHRRLVEARAEKAPTAALEANRARLEQELRRRRHRLAVTGGPIDGSHRDPGDQLDGVLGGGGFAVDRLLAALGDTVLVQLVDVDGRLIALVCGRGAVRRHVLGSAHEAAQAVGTAHFALRQAARGRPVALEGVADRLQAALLGTAARSLPSGPVVLSPVSRLHAAPWTLLPALRDVPVSVVPSATSWLRTSVADRSGGPRVFIAGPGMPSGGAEVAVLAGRYDDAIVLRDGTATIGACLQALDGASVGHIAAHGRFRSDSPLFSALEVDDGPLTAYDLEGLDRAPRRLVLSACESGMVAPIGAGELLGFTSAMLSLGTVGLVSSVEVVNDAAAATLMVEVHRWLAELDDLPEAMRRTRAQVRGDRLLEATAASFLTLGV